MEKAYYLQRKRASLKQARDATSAEARLAHYDLAGRYSVKAGSAETRASDLASSLPRPIHCVRSNAVAEGIDDD